MESTTNTMDPNKRRKHHGSDVMQSGAVASVSGATTEPQAPKESTTTVSLSGASTDPTKPQAPKEAVSNAPKKPASLTDGASDFPRKKSRPRASSHPWILGRAKKGKAKNCSSPDPPKCIKCLKRTRVAGVYHHMCTRCRAEELKEERANRAKAKEEKENRANNPPSPTSRKCPGLDILAAAANDCSDTSEVDL
ncbi:hypothetical protein ACHAXT_006508 [Thalassiosira profunda]